jgi:hypothetical protein
MHSLARDPPHILGDLTLLEYESAAAKRRNMIARHVSAGKANENYGSPAGTALILPSHNGTGAALGVMFRTYWIAPGVLQSKGTQPRSGGM